MTGYNDQRTWRHLYGRKWRRRREQHLAGNPLCVRCTSKGLVVAADVVDHIKPHKGDAILFWDPTNWQSLCKTCHDGFKQALEHAAPQCDEEGYTVDASW